MKNRNKIYLNKPSLAARMIKWQLEKRGIKSYITQSMSGIAGVTFFCAILYLVMGVISKKPLHIITASIWMALSVFWFMLCGCFELIDREYIKKDSNQQLDPIVPSPASIISERNSETVQTSAD